MTNGQDHEELLRVRTRLHALRSSMAAIGWRVHNLEEWRREHQGEADKAFAQLRELVAHEETAKAIAFALRHRGRVELTWVQRLAAVVVFALTLFDFLDRVLHVK